MLLLRGRLPGATPGGHVQQHHCVMVGGSGFGDVDAETLTGGAFQSHALEGEGDRADVRREHVASMATQTMSPDYRLRSLTCPDALGSP